jgi:hypothetical protein
MEIQHTIFHGFPASKLEVDAVFCPLSFDCWV